MKKHLSIAFSLIFAFVLVLEGGCSADNTHQPNLQSVIYSKLDLGDTYVEQTAVTMARDYPGEFSINQVGAIYDTLVQGWNYYSDPSYKELYKNANLTLQDGMRAGTVGVGDCDDFAILISSLIDSLGGSTRIIFAYDEASRQGHAYSELYLGKKDSPMIEDLEGWIKDEYGKPSVPGVSLTEDEVWLNLDYNGTYPGGPFFGEKWVSKTVAWESKNKTSPKIVPLIDPMENLSNWKTLKDDLGSNVSIGLVPSKKGRAINLSYDLKDNGWVGISKEVDSRLLAELQGLNISYRMTGKQSTLEIRLEDQNGTVFGSSRILSGDPLRWACLEALYDSFTELIQASAEDPIQKGLEPARIRKLEFFIHNNIKRGDISGPGNISLDQIKGVMRVDKDSPFAKAKDIRDENVALDLASKSRILLESKPTNYLIKSVLLAAESLRHKETFEGYMALRRSLKMLHPSVVLLECDSISDMTFSPDGKTLATGGRDDTARVWNVETGEEMQRLENAGFVSAVAFSSDGTKLATASDDSTARIWDVQTGEQLKKLKFDDDETIAIAVAFSREDHRVVIIFNRRASEVYHSINDTVEFFPGHYGAIVWDTESGKELRKWIHEGNLTNVVLSPDEKTLAISSYENGTWHGNHDNRTRLWDIQTGKQLHKLDYDNSVSNMAFSRDGTKLATASDDSTARIWDVQTGKEHQKLKHNGQVLSVTFSLDETKLATASEDNTARIWDVQTGKELQRLKNLIGVKDVAFSRDGTKLATASDDSTARIWDVQTGKQLKELEYDKSSTQRVGGPVYKVAFSPDGTKLATTGLDVAYIWDARIDKLLQRLEHDKSVNAMAISPDGKILAMLRDNNSVQLWDVRTDRELHRLEDDSPVQSAMFSPDGKTLITISGNGSEPQSLEYNSSELRFDGEKFIVINGKKNGWIWDIQGGKKRQKLEHIDGVVAFSPDSKTLSAIDNNAIRLWDTETGLEKRRLVHDNTINFVVFSDSRTLISVIYPSLWQFWDVQTGERLLRLEQIDHIDFSSNNKTLAATDNNTTHLWDIKTGKELHRLNHDNNLSDLAFSPDVTKLATACREIVQIWDVQTGKELHRLNNDYDVYSMGFIQDGKILVTDCLDKASPKLPHILFWQLWDVQTGRQLYRLSREGLHKSAFSPDHKTFATEISGDRNVHLLDIQTGKELQRLETYNWWSGLVFSPDGTKLATFFLSIISIWNTQTGKEMQRLETDNFVSDVAFSPDGKTLIVRRLDGNSSIWHLDSSDLINEACSRLPRNLTLEEWHQYLGDEPYRETCACQGYRSGDGS
jgi:WD40 repeat protein